MSRQGHAGPTLGALVEVLRSEGGVRAANTKLRSGEWRLVLEETEVTMTAKLAVLPKAAPDLLFTMAREASRAYVVSQHCVCRALLAWLRRHHWAFIRHHTYYTLTNSILHPGLRGDVARERMMSGLVWPG